MTVTSPPAWGNAERGFADLSDTRPICTVAQVCSRNKYLHLQQIFYKSLKGHPMRKKTLALFLALCGLFFLSGCDQVRQALGDMINPPSASEVTARVSALAAQGKAAQAIQVGEDFLLKNKDASGDLHRKLAQLHTSQGDVVSAVRHLQQSTAGAPTPQPASPATQPSAPSTKTAEPAATAGTAASVDGAAAKVGPNGVEVRAGDVSIKISK
jgi:hypothetical protein